MWSKRRRRIARQFDVKKHIEYRFMRMFEKRVAELLERSIDKAILYGEDYIHMKPVLVPSGFFDFMRNR